MTKCNMSEVNYHVIRYGQRFAEINDSTPLITIDIGDIHILDWVTVTTCCNKNINELDNTNPLLPPPTKFFFFIFFLIYIFFSKKTTKYK